MVNERVQFLYLVTWMSSLLLVGAAVGTGYSMYHLHSRQPIEVFGWNPYFVVGGLVFVVVVSALTLGVNVVVHTHRMLGSAYRIGSHLSQVNKGEHPGPVTLREGDYFKDVADELNKLGQRS
jgi:hypothetical protein